MNTRKGTSQLTGRWGEGQAAEYLTGHGVKILGKNIQTPYGEIDLLGEDENQLLFIEVKTLRSRKFGPPEVSVSARKQAHMINSALHYLQEMNLTAREWRIDVLSIQAQPPEQLEFHWFKNALSE